VVKRGVRVEERVELGAFLKSLRFSRLVGCVWFFMGLIISG
jgi:hypothetical protein